MRLDQYHEDQKKKAIAAWIFSFIENAAKFEKALDSWDLLTHDDKVFFRAMLAGERALLMKMHKRLMDES